MPGIYSALDIAKSALLTYQLAISVTGQNVANANTEGYSRQRVVTETRVPMDYTPGQVGTGVTAVEIERIVDKFISGQLTDAISDESMYGVEKDALKQIEMLFDAEGLQTALTDFFDAWEDLANASESSTQSAREVLLSKSEQLCNMFNTLYSDLESMQTGDLNYSIEVTVGEVNALTKEIADLNEKIFLAESKGENANDYRDSRDLALEKLASLVDISYFEDDTGKVNVSLANGLPLVENLTSYELGTSPIAGSNLFDLVWKDPHDPSGASDQIITNVIQGGSLKGYLEIRDGVISDLMGDLDELVNNLIEKVNYIHENGYGRGTPPSTGTAFFTGTGASDFAVNPALLLNADLVAASGTSAGSPGDNENAKAIANLRDDGAITDYLVTIIGDLGSAVQAAEQSYEHQADMVTHLDNYKESVSGVNLDEEMINLIMYQHAYNAAAQLVTHCDEMLQTILGMV